MSDYLLSKPSFVVMVLIGLDFCNSNSSDVMQVANHYFENALAYFTRRIHRCISMACANGEVAPFVGHNAYVAHLVPVSLSVT